MKKTCILITQKLFVFFTVFALLLNPFTITFALEETSETNYQTYVETIEENTEDSTYEDDSYTDKEELEDEEELKEEFEDLEDDVESKEEIEVKDSILSQITQSIPEKVTVTVAPRVDDIVALDDTPTPGLGSGPWLNLGDVDTPGTFAYDNFWETAEDASQEGVYRITVNQINNTTVLYSINGFDDLAMTQEDGIFPTPHSNTWDTDPTNSANNFTNTNSQIVHHFPQDFTQVTNQAIAAGSPGELNVQYYSIMNNTSNTIIVSYVGAVYGGYDNHGNLSTAFDEEQWSQWINTSDSDFISGVTLKPGQTMPIFLINWGLTIDADNTQENIHYNIVFTWDVEVVQYEVTFDPGTQGTWTAVTQEVLSNSAMPTPPTTGNPGFIFNGWVDQFGNVYNSRNPLPSTVDQTYIFTAQWLTEFAVIFDPGIAIDPITGEDAWDISDYTFHELDPGEPMPTPPSTIVFEGHIFTGWLDQDGILYNDSNPLPTSVNQNYTFTAQWEVVYTVVFDPGTQGTWTASSATTQDILSGTNMPTPPTTTGNPGYVFVGWIDQEGIVYNTRNLLPTTVTQSYTFTAQWKGEFVVTYDPGIANNPDKGGPLWDMSDYTFGDLELGDTIPTAPSTVLVNPDPNPDPSTHWRPGHVFAGWLVTDTTGKTFYPVTVGNTPNEVPAGATIMPVNTPVPTQVNGNMTFTAQWLPAVYVMFVLQVEGLLSYPHTHAVAIPVGTNVDDNNVDPDLNVWLDQYLSVYLDVDLYQQAFQDFPGWSGYSYIDGNQVSNSLTIETPLTDTQGIYVFEGSLTLQRFTVVFVDPLVNLYGQTIEVPFGSTLKEPSIHHPQYFLPEGVSSAGWFMNVINDVDQAVDTISSPTPSMPGNSANPAVNARVITLGINDDVRITPGGGLVGWHPTPIHPHEMEILELESDRVIELDTSNKVEFNFNGNEITGPTDPANMTRVTSNKVIVRLHQEETPQPSPTPTPTPTPTPPPVVPPKVVVAPAPRIPTTGGFLLSIVLTSTALGSLVLVRNKIKKD